MEGMVYPMFNKDTHVKEFEHDKFKYYFRSIDPGFTNPFCCLFIGLDFDNNIHVFDEIYQSQVLDDDKITMIKAKHASYHYNNTYVDPEDANFRAVLRKHGIQNRASLKDVMKGIMKVQEKLAIKENGLPSLYIHPKCKNLINELQFYKWEESKIDKPIKEQPVKIKDHAVDALRYFVYTHYKYYSGGASNIGAD
jgi:phage terminase large subunit